MRRDSGYTFSQVPRADIPRSVFNRTHTHKLTFDAGWLIPFYLDEVLPGDTFNVNVSLFARLATPIVPLMDDLFLDVFFFLVPNRLLWDNWQRFCGEQTTPGASTDFVVPQNQAGATGFIPGSLFDHFGLPPNIPNISVCAFPARAYNLIYQEWFRDQNMVGAAPVYTDDGPQLASAYGLFRRGKRHDYFTSCLPWPQKGPGVSISLGNNAPVYMNNGVPGTTKAAVSNVPGSAAQAYELETFSGTPPVPIRLGAQTLTGGPNLFADLSESTAVTINSLREAFQLQKMLERDARGGTRYVEILQSHFGVTSPDARLQRPEFLGGGTIPVHINPVMQTSGTPPDLSTGYADTPQGNLAAYGTVSGSVGFTKSFVEHGIVMGICSVRGNLTYQQGVNRMWKREVREDFYWPALAHLGEQAVLQGEIYALGTSQDEIVFGYQERWAEYRYHPSIVSGKFRSSDPQSLDYWHLAQDFSAPPTLNTTFIDENPPIARCIAVPSEPHFLMDSLIQCRAARPMPVYSVPGYIDHF